MPTLTTPIFGIPYPDGDELVSDGDAAFAALAQGIEAALSPPWTALTPLGTNYTARAGYFVPAYRVFGDGRVQLRGGMSKATAILSGDVLFTLPTAARPTAVVALPVVVSRSVATKNPAGKISIATTGAVTIEVADPDAPAAVMLDGAAFSAT